MRTPLPSSYRILCGFLAAGLLLGPALACSSRKGGDAKTPPPQAPTQPQTQEPTPGAPAKPEAGEPTPAGMDHGLWQGNITHGQTEHPVFALSVPREAGNSEVWMLVPGDKHLMGGIFLPSGKGEGKVYHQGRREGTFQAQIDPASPANGVRGTAEWMSPQGEKFDGHFALNLKAATAASFPVGTITRFVAQADQATWDSKIELFLKMTSDSEGVFEGHKGKTSAPDLKGTFQLVDKATGQLRLDISELHGQEVMATCEGHGYLLKLPGTDHPCFCMVAANDHKAVWGLFTEGRRPR